MTEHEYTADEQWQAIIAHTTAGDSPIFYAVRTTGVYCRPTCPSRRPLRCNVTFFATPTLAEAAGYRPCRRCQPDQIPDEQRALAIVQQLLDTADQPPSLTELAHAAGYSPTHLQKLFKRATGLSPRQYAGTVRSERLKSDLRQGATVTDAGYAAGYGSSRALYEGGQRELGMPPGAYRRGGAGQTIHYTSFESSLGTVMLAATERGLCALRFGDPATLQAELAAEFPKATLQLDAGGKLQPYVEAAHQVLRGLAWQPGLAIDPQGTAFQQRVWAALRGIPRGQTCTYGEVAQTIGQPTAVRAVANACARNPLAVVTPCHRVVAANGKPGGYRWGIARKHALLAMETAPSPTEAGADAAREAMPHSDGSCE